jgi:hypothetical protein
MNTLARVVVGEKVVATSLEDLLTELSRYGRPRVILTDSGWYCAIEMNTTAIGATFKVDSDFTNRSPFDAALQCRDRMRDALSKIGAA